MLRKYSFVFLNIRRMDLYAQQSYVTVTLHGIDMFWSLKSFVLGHVPVMKSEDAEFLAATVRDTLSSWNLSLDNVISITTDGAKTGPACVRNILKKQWIYCIPHALSRAFQVSLSKNLILQLIVEKAREFCKVFRISPEANHALVVRAHS